MPTEPENPYKGRPARSHGEADVNASLVAAWAQGLRAGRAVAVPADRPAPRVAWDDEAEAIVIDGPRSGDSHWPGHVSIWSPSSWSIDEAKAVLVAGLAAGCPAPQITDEMVERVAKAIHGADCGCDDAYVVWRPTYDRIARAALAALGDPRPAAGEQP